MPGGFAMKCPKCGYTSFPHLESCRKCGQDLAEVRELFGVYGLPPNPPDLLLVYETSQGDAGDTIVAEAAPTAAVDLGELEEIELHLTEAAEPPTSPSQESAHSDATLEIVPTLDFEVEPVSPLSPRAGEMDQTSDEEPIMIDLGGLEGLTLEMREVDEEEETTPPGTLDSHTSSAAPPAIFDLDLDEDESPSVHETTPPSSDLDDDEDASSPEYILEIDEGLEIEVDEIEIDEADDEEEDEDER
jgi:hypothetical protein